MLGRQIVTWCASFLCVLTCSACVPRPNKLVPRPIHPGPQPEDLVPRPDNLVPQHVDGGQGAFFGHIEVVDVGGKDITGECYIYWADGVDHKRAMKLDYTGWVFSTVPIGPTFLWEARCELSNLRYSAREVAFQVPGNGTIVYFGHVRIQPGGAPIQDRFSEAVLQYQVRYGKNARALKAEVAILSNSRGAVGVFANASPPAVAAGFALGGDLAAAQIRCTDAGLTWQQLGDDAASCSGAAVDLGMPITVKLTTCGGAICGVVMEASADGAAWSTLAQRFTKLARLLEKEHGNQFDRVTRALEGCTTGSANCATSGRALKSETWRWPDKHSVSLVLDGGPLGGVPSLRVVYHTGAYIERKP